MMCGPLCDPGMNRMQPLSSVESENAIQAVTDSGGSSP